MSEIKTLVYGQWTIEVDVKKTREYYANFEIEDSQAHRNFAAYCENLSEEEKQFFDDFGINPLCCRIEHIGASRKGEFPCGGKYPFFGKYIEKPKSSVVSVGSVFKREFEVTGPGVSVYAGIFKFDFMADPIELNEVAEELPEGAQCIEFWCEDMKWQLDEPCEDMMYEEPKPWQLGLKLGDRLNEIKGRKKYREETKRAVEAILDQQGIAYKALTKNETEEHKKIWVNAFSPAGSDRSQIRKLCLKNRGAGVFLWHMFSFEILDAEEGPAANVLFDEAKKGGCILIENTCDAAYAVKDASKLTSAILQQLTDVTVTSRDFLWTYSKTHEEMCGPYYWHR